MFHPFQVVPPEWRARLLWPVLALALALLIYMNVAAQPLITAAAPWGIVSLELASTSDAARGIVESWKEKHPPAPRVDTLEGAVQNVPRGVDELASTLTLVDFAFIPLYALALSMACVWLAEGARRPAPGVLLGWAIWIAAACDALENSLMLRELAGMLDDPLPALPRAFAVTKFAIVLTSLAYVAYSLATRRRAGAR